MNAIDTLVLKNMSFVLTVVGYLFYSVEIVVSFDYYFFYIVISIFTRLPMVVFPTVIAVKVFPCKSAVAKKFKSLQKFFSNNGTEEQREQENIANGINGDDLPDRIVNPWEYQIPTYWFKLCLYIKVCNVIDNLELFKVWW